MRNRANQKNPGRAGKLGSLTYFKSLVKPGVQACQAYKGYPCLAGFLHTLFKPGKPCSFRISRAWFFLLLE